MFLVTDLLIKLKMYFLLTQNLKNQHEVRYHITSQEKKNLKPVIYNFMFVNSIFIIDPRILRMAIAGGNLC